MCVVTSSNHTHIWCSVLWWSVLTCILLLMGPQSSESWKAGHIWGEFPPIINPNTHLRMSRGCLLPWLTLHLSLPAGQRSTWLDPFKHSNNFKFCLAGLTRKTLTLSQFLEKVLFMVVLSILMMENYDTYGISNRLNYHPRTEKPDRALIVSLKYQGLGVLFAMLIQTC